MDGMLSVGMNLGCRIFCSVEQCTMGHNCSSQRSECEDA